MRDEILAKTFCHKRAMSCFSSPVSAVYAWNAWDHDPPFGEENGCILLLGLSYESPSKNRMHLIFLGNLSLRCFSQHNKARIYSLTPTTKSRRLRSAAFIQNSECMARTASLIWIQRTDLIYNFSILNFHLINSSCSAAVDRVRNYSGKLTLPLLRQEDPQLFWLRA